MIDKVNILQQQSTESDLAKDKTQKIKEVASEFESLFILQMLKQMRSSVIKGGLVDDSKGEEIYRSMMDNELSRVIASGKGIGIKDMLLRQLTKDNVDSASSLLYKEKGKGIEIDTMATNPMVSQTRGPVSDYPERSDQRFRLPLEGRVTSEYGIRKDPITGDSGFHRGMDIAAQEGTPIYPSMKGLVVYSGEKSGYGNVVEVKHSNGYLSRYAHNSKNMVKKGDNVDTSDIIALVGKTGRATGAHLHFEMRVEGFAVNPVDLLT